MVCPGVKQPPTPTPSHLQHHPIYWQPMWWPMFPQRPIIERQTGVIIKQWAFPVSRLCTSVRFNGSVCLEPQRRLLAIHRSQAQKWKQTWRRPRTLDRGKLGALLGYVFFKESQVHLTDRHIIKVNDGVIPGDVTMHSLLLICVTASANNQNDPKLGGHEIFL